MIETVMETSLSARYVVLSFLVSAVGAFVALTAAGGIVRPDRSLNKLNLAAAGLALGGIAVWSMHFIGMLALEVRLGIGYSVTESLVSLVAAVVGTGAALAWVSRNPNSLPHVVIAGVALGLAVCVMHYLGMYGMRFGGFFRWSYELVGASVLIALVAATAALWLAFRVRGVGARAAASLIMAGAVCAMHYTGMAAAQFVCTTDKPLSLPRGLGIVPSMELPSLVIVLSVGMAMLILLDQALQRMLAAQAR